MYVTTCITLFCCTFQPDGPQPFVKVSRADVDQLVTEIMQVKEFLPKVVSIATLKKSTQLVSDYDTWQIDSPKDL